MTAKFVKQLPGNGFTVRDRPGPYSDYTTGMTTARSSRRAQKNSRALQPERDGEGMTIPRQAARYQIVYARRAGRSGRDRAAKTSRFRLTVGSSRMISRSRRIVRGSTSRSVASDLSVGHFRARSAWSIACIRLSNGRVP
jgi:hypothetical protein